MQRQLKSQFTILELTDRTIDEANQMRLQSWLDTYVNDEYKVTREWIEERNKGQMSEEVKARRLERLTNSKYAGWVALDNDGKVIGVTTLYIDDEGHQHVGSLYVQKYWHGKGVAGQLMQMVMGWLDDTKPIVLSVVSYNERAKAFYRKWGFEELSNSVSLFDDRIPEVKMVRKGKP